MTSPMPTVKRPRCRYRVDAEAIDERSPRLRRTHHHVESEENLLRDGDKLLRSGSRLKWMVPLLGGTGNPSPCGVPAVFETGLLERSEWNGVLVSAGEGPNLSMGPGRNEFAGGMAPR